MDSYPGMPLEQFVREASLAELMGYASDDGMNLLSTLVLRKDLDTASKLLDRGFPPDENNWGFVTSALTEAAGIGDLEGMKFLLARGANVNGHEHEDMPPLHAALRLNQDQAALLLIEYGAAVDRIDEGGMSALDRAVGAEIIQKLTLAGARRRKP